MTVGDTVLSEEIRKQTFTSDSYTCQRCNESYKDQPEKLEPVLIQPLTEGGSYDPDNLRTYCEECTNRPKFPETLSNTKESESGGFEPLNKVQTVESYVEDSFRVMKVTLPLYTFFFLAIQIAISTGRITDVPTIINGYTEIAAAILLTGVVFAGLQWGYVRRYAPTSSALEAKLDNDEEIQEERRATITTVHRRATILTIAFSVSVAIATALLVLGIVAALDVSIMGEQLPLLREFSLNASGIFS